MQQQLTELKGLKQELAYLQAAVELVMDAGAREEHGKLAGAALAPAIVDSAGSQ